MFNARCDRFAATRTYNGEETVDGLAYRNELWADVSVEANNRNGKAELPYDETLSVGDYLLMPAEGM